MNLVPLRDANGNILHDANGKALQMERVADPDEPPPPVHVINPPFHVSSASPSGVAIITDSRPPEGPK